MKKIIASILVLSSIFGILTASAKKPSYEPIKIDYVYEREGNVTFSVNPAVELLFIAARLAGFESFTRYENSDYLNQIDLLFEKYKNSDFVLKLKKLKDAGLSDIALIQLSYYLEPDFSGTTVSIKPVPKELKNYWGGLNSSELNTLVKMLNEFAKKTNFQRIYILNKSTYINFVMGAINDMKKDKVFEWVANYFGNGDLEPVHAELSILAGYAWGGIINNNGVIERHMTVLPSFNKYACVLSFCQTFGEELANDIWEDVEKNFTDYYHSYIVKYNDVKAVRNFNGDLFPNEFMIQIIMKQIFSQQKRII